MKYCIAIFLLATTIQVSSQVVYQPISSSVYSFLDELANERIIQLNSVVKPYPRKLIATKLAEAEKQKETLNQRQQKELEFYLKDFNKELKPDKNFKKRLDLFYWKDSLFRFTVNPIIGGRYYANSNGSVFHRWSGAEAFGNIGTNFAFYASLRDNGISEALSTPGQLTQFPGGNFKNNQGVDMQRTDYSEMKGGVTWACKWGSFGLLKDHFTWGNNYNGANIFSGRPPSFAYLQLKLHPVEWLDFNYIHGWLVSQVVDSTKSYFLNGTRRRVFHDKYLAANIFTIKPTKGLNISLGNSVIYGDIGENPAYLIPFMFYKSVDHTYNGTGANDIGQNSQMFFDISSRQLKKCHLYTTLFLDELSISNMMDDSMHTNLLSWKIGARLVNIIPNVLLTAEYTRTNPWTYTHHIEVTTFESNQYNLGHYLQQNAEEIFFGLQYKPVRGLHLNLSYSQANKGPEMVFEEANGTNNVPGSVWMEGVNWSESTISFRATYEVMNDVMIHTEFTNRSNGGNTTYTPNIYRGNTNTVVAGINLGF